MSQIFKSSTSGGVTRYPITPYTVGPIGQAAYQTVQSAIDAANTAGGGLVFIQDPGAYTENLTMHGGVDIMAAPCNAVSITGVHTPPTTGSAQFTNITFISATDIFNTNAASQTIIITFVNCIFQVTDGYTFNVPNLAGSNINIYNCTCEGSNDGFLSGSNGGIQLTVDSSTVGNGSTHTLSSISSSVFTNSVFFCPISVSAGGFYATSCIFVKNVSIEPLGDDLLFSSCVFGLFSDFPNMQININSSGFAVAFENCVINTASSPAITGTADTVYLSGVSFLRSADIASTITLATGDRFSCGSGIITNPVNSASSSLILGTAFQNTTGYDVLLHVYLSVASATTASILCGVGSTNTPTQQTIVSGLTVVATSIIPVNVYLPKNYYALISTSGTITVAISGQQITTI